MHSSKKPPAFHKQWGELESPLTILGEEQARKRAEELRNIQFDAVFSSDLTRAKQTAEILKLERELAVQTTKAIRERVVWSHIDELVHNGKSIESITDEMKKELKELDEKGKMAYKYSQSIESAEEAASRLFTFLREIAVAYLGKTVLVVNHGNNMRSLLTHLGWAKFDELPGDSIANTAYVVLESDGTDFFVKETSGFQKHTNAIRTL